MLDGMSQIPDLVKKCKQNGMYAMALTDHGNMFGIKEFLDIVKKENGKVKTAIKQQEAIANDAEAQPEARQQAMEQIAALKQTIFKPIVGTEAYCAHQSRTIKDGRGWHLILLAKNQQGYHNLCKISSYAYTEGFYYTSRMDHELLERYHEGIICCSACLGGEVPQKILAGDVQGAEESVLWFKRLFGDDYYLELQRHQTDKPRAAYDTYEKQQIVNKVLIDLARKHNIKLIATNDVHFVEEEHGEAHDRLICLSTGKDFDDPTRMHYTKQEWLKTPDEMAAIFQDIPEALTNTVALADTVETYSIDSDPIMPVFPIPESFGTEAEYRSRITEQELFDEFTRNEKGEVVLTPEQADEKIKRLGGYNKLYRIKFEADYLAKLTWDGAHKRYGETLNEEQTERIIFELHTIKTMGFPGYFLIVQDYIRAAREELDVSVGPGRGSAAGSVVAYCLWITDIDPLKYDLLFERFLNPDRISLPDIDVDFEDSGRGKVLDWITNKYGVEKVAHIITYGTMAAKSSLADVGRVQRVPLATVNAIKELIPDRNFPDGVKDENGKSPTVNLYNCYKYIPELKPYLEGDNENIKSMLKYAAQLENTNRQVGMHACGIIIGADDLTNVVPICTITDKETKQEVVVTQYDGSVVESVGLIKMDFLGLKNLTIIKDALHSIKKRHGIDLNIDTIPLDDELTYQLFCEGNTIGTFQFESPGMQKYLRELQPHVFGDIIAMNALYRPGPMDYIPDFIDRKQGRKPVTYDIPCMEKYLSDTYGITVYQEQVMLLSRELAGFTRGQSDTLRKAMGKKQIAKMNELEVLFYEGGEKNGYDRQVLHKIWEDWKKFASYAFNKSHATCYSWVAYQTAYLKAHYPAEYMAAVMTSGLTENKRVTQLIEECRRMGIAVLAPDINESDINFSVNQHGEIRFGLGAIIGMGAAASSAIIDERNEHGPFKDIFDLLSRVDLKSINRKSIEVLVKSGALDCFTGMHRAQYLYKENDLETTPSYTEILLRWATRKHELEMSRQMSLFDLDDTIKGDDHPPIPNCQSWSDMQKSIGEKEATGFFITTHPLNTYSIEIKSYVHNKLPQLSNLHACLRLERMTFACAVMSAKTGNTQRGGTYGNYLLEDYDGSYELRLYDDKNQMFKPFLEVGNYVFLRAHVEQMRYRQKDGSYTEGNPRLIVDEVRLLSGLAAKAKKLQFHIDLMSISDELCAQLKSLFNKHKGNSLIEAIVDYPQKGLCMHMASSIPVDIAPCMAALKAIPEIHSMTLIG